MDVVYAGVMERLLANAGAKVRRAFHQGREYLVAPLTLIVPGVLNGSQGSLYYPPDEIERSTKVWNDVPIVVYHPFNQDGRPASAKDPEVQARQGVGFLRNARFNKKLVTEGWFDAERARKVDERVWEALTKNRPMELSTGLFTENVPAKGVDERGRFYQFIARNYRPDHLAVLPDQVGACSLQDGCGVLVNRRHTRNAMKRKRFSIRDTVLNYNPSQPRNSRGRWGSGGGGGGAMAPDTGGTFGGGSLGKGKGSSKVHGAAGEGAKDLKTSDRVRTGYSQSDEESKPLDEAVRKASIGQPKSISLDVKGGKVVGVKEHGKIGAAQEGVGATTGNDNYLKETGMTPPNKFLGWKARPAGNEAKGDVAEIEEWSGARSYLHVTSVEEDIKNGSPGASGYLVEADGTPKIFGQGFDGKWVYSDQIKTVYKKPK